MQDERPLKSDDITPEVEAAAKFLVDNKEFRVIVNARMESLKKDVLDSVEEKELKDTHKEYTSLLAFFEWVAEAAS